MRFVSNPGAVVASAITSNANPSGIRRTGERADALRRLVRFEFDAAVDDPPGNLNPDFGLAAGGDAQWQWARDFDRRALATAGRDVHQPFIGRDEVTPEKRLHHIVRGDGRAGDGGAVPDRGSC